LGSNSQKPDGDNSHECERPRLHHFVEQHALNSELERHRFVNSIIDSSYLFVESQHIDWRLVFLSEVYIADLQNRLTLANLGRSASSSFTLSAKYLISLSRVFNMLFVASLP